MKKTLRILASAVLAASMLFAVGCAKDASASVEKVGKWGDTNINQGNYLLRIEADKHPINWWVLTETNGAVIPSSNYTCEKITLNGKRNERDYTFVDTLTDRGKLETNEIVQIKFDDKYLTGKKDILVWFEYGSSDKEKFGKDEVILSEMTCRGKIDITPTSGRHIKASEYPEFVIPMGTLTVKCGETRHNNPTGVSSNGKIQDDKLVKGNWHGSYEITEVWPLTKSATTGKYDALDGLKIKELDVKEGSSAEIIFPTTADYVAVKQPSRFNPEEAKNTEDTYSSTVTPSYNGQAWDWVEAEAKKDQKDWYWCAKKTVAKNKSAKVNTQECKFYFDLKDNKVYNSDKTPAAAYAYVPPIIIDAADIKDGADLK